MKAQNTTATPTHWFAVIASLSVAFMIALEVNAVTLAVVPIAKYFSVSIDSCHWLITLYLFAYALVMLLAGRIGDHFGPRYLIIIGLSLFVIASLFGGMATNLKFLFAMRVLQGIGGGIAWTNLVVYIRKKAGDRKAFITGVLVAVTGVGAACGPILGGFIIDALSWRWIMWINIPFVLFAMLPPIFSSCERTSPRSAAELPRMSCIVYFLVSILLVLVAFQSLNFASVHPLWVGLLVLVVLINSYLLIKTQPKNKRVMDWALFIKRYFVAGLFWRHTLSVFWFSFVFLLAVLLQEGLAMSPAHAGLILLPVAAVFAFMAYLSPRLVARFSLHKVLYAGIGVAATSLVVFLLAPVNVPVIICLSSLTGMGFGVIGTSALTQTTHHISEEQQSEATAWFYWFGFVTGMLSVALASGVLHHYHSVMASATALDILSRALRTTIAIELVYIIALAGVMSLIRFDGKHIWTK